ncbi:hypothetical protein ACWOC1_05775 [Enterococcus quebecensis]|uniref:Uncharacterized protein n=1 Tax=Enterococcus quebecensis TaxID=903983 RepID=A0A1E5GUW8_9ENTE|nr:hypothetical protein [Enterococcus quebecensis]OEG16471.1 hypothetical protein BCR23_06170 [Enterococcus quebecensis]OJG74161.1 putative membrane protein [Enterococcus quebecensis]
MHKIAFAEAEKDIYLDDIETIVTMSSNSSSYTNKIIFSSLFSALISFPSLNYYWGISMVSLSILFFLLIKYLTLNNFQKVVNYNTYLYMIVQTGVIFFLTVFLYIKKDTYHIVPIIYITISYMLSLFIVYFKTSNLLRAKYNLGHSKWSKKSELFATKTSKLLGIFVILIVLGTIIYRINRWWLLNVDITFESVSITEYILWGGGLIFLLIGLTLLPTLLIKPENIVKYKLIEKYAEDFREKYDYSKKEWYGDN